jgi:acetolactate synthase-1/2/3 large subunit
MSIEKKQSEQQTGADIVVKTLEQHNVKWVFGIPGAKIDKVFNRLVDSSIPARVNNFETLDHEVY